MKGETINLKNLNYNSDPKEFWKICVADMFEEYSSAKTASPKFLAMFNAAEDLTDFEKRILKSSDPDVTMTQAYAMLSKYRGGHWYRLRNMMGNKCRKVESDAGGLKVGDDHFSILINGEGDGITRYAVFNRDEWNPNMATFTYSVEGIFNIYAYDCGDEVAETLSGRYGVYTYEGIVIFERWE